MSPIKDGIVSTESASQYMVAVYKVSPESALRERSVSLNDAISELIFWRYATAEPLVNEARISDALDVLKAIKGAIDQAIEAKTNARTARWDSMEVCNHG